MLGAEAMFFMIIKICYTLYDSVTHRHNRAVTAQLAARLSGASVALPCVLGESCPLPNGHTR